jgi:polyisoprenoid-binding protein YceI
MTQLQTERGMVKVPGGTWTVDPSHSSVAFEVKHLMIATVRGHFAEFEGTLEAAEEDPTESRAWGSVKTASIDTGSPDRDTHLRGPEFFDCGRYPEMRFVSTRIEPREGGTYRIFGDLTIKATTREIEVEATVEGVAEDPWGHQRVGVAIRGTVDRSEFGLDWNQALSGGGLLVGNEVKVQIDVSAVRAQP